MQYNKLIVEIKRRERKTEKQIQNLKKIGEAAKEFHKNCDTLTNSVRDKIDLLRCGEDYAIIEVAHQPNFMPYYGVWKKAVFAYYLRKMLDEKGVHAIALFGFVDQDTTMNSFLFRNKIPYYSKEGYKNIGFKIKGKNEWWRMWCKQPLPPREAVKKQIDCLIKTYTSHGLLRDDVDLVLLEKLLRECYICDCSFSEANAMFFSKVCNQVYNLDVLFFTYSKAQESNIFTNGLEYLLPKRKDYIDIYNKTIEQKGLKIEKVSKDHVPFWYHCECGGKVRLKVINEKERGILLEGVCPICGGNFKIETERNFDLDKIYKSISFKAVSRELIVPNTLGSDIYIEGSGGSLAFRQVSNIIAEKLGFNMPLAVRWRSHDKYISLLLHKAISNFTRRHPISSLKYELREIETSYHQLYERIAGLYMEQNALKSELKKYKPQSNDFFTILEKLKEVNKERKKNNAEMTRYLTILSNFQGLSNACTLIPSIADGVLSVGFSNILKCWLLDLKEKEFDAEHIIQLPMKKIEKVDMQRCLR